MATFIATNENIPRTNIDSFLFYCMLLLLRARCQKRKSTVTQWKISKQTNQSTTSTNAISFGILGERSGLFQWNKLVSKKFCLRNHKEISNIFQNIVWDHLIVWIRYSSENSSHCTCSTSQCCCCSLNMYIWHASFRLVYGCRAMIGQRDYHHKWMGMKNRRYISDM